METKYTTDGRKVVVVGQLNQTETIVQEVYILDGQEVFRGEKFTAKRLLSAPPISWKENQTKAADKLYKQSQDRLKEERCRYNVEVKRMKVSMEKHIQMLQDVMDFDFSTIADFLSGRITHVVLVKHSSIEIQALDDALEYSDRYDTGLRLISLFGGKKRTLNWGLNTYPDGSGSNFRIYPCLSLTAAKKKASQLIRAEIKEKGVTDAHVKARKEFSLSTPTVRQVQAHADKREREALGAKKAGIDAAEARYKKQLEVIQELRAI